MLRFMFCGVLTVLLGTMAGAQDRPDLKDFAKWSQPGPEHELLRSFAGTWELTVEGQKGKGRAEFKPMLGGRFVMEEAKIPFGESTLEWVGIYGFDKDKKKYTAVWVDNLDTTTESGEGEANGSAVSFRGQHLDRRTGKMAAFVWRLARTGDAAITIQMFGTGADGKEQKVLEVRGTRMPSTQ